MSCICHSRHLSKEGKMFFYAKNEGVYHMNPHVIEYYENLFKYEIMQMQFDGARKTLNELVEQFFGQDEAHHSDIYTAYCNVRKEIIG